MSCLTSGTWVQYTPTETPGVFGGGGGAGSPNCYNPDGGGIPRALNIDHVDFFNVNNNVNNNYGYPGQKGGDGICVLFAQVNGSNNNTIFSGYQPNSTGTPQSGFPSTTVPMANSSAFFTITSANSNEQGNGPTIYGGNSAFMNLVTQSNNSYQNHNQNISAASGTQYFSIILGPGNYIVETNIPIVSMLLVGAGGGGAGGPTFPFSYQCAYQYDIPYGLLNGTYNLGGGGGCGGGGGGGGAVIVRELYLYETTAISNGGTNNYSLTTRFTISVGSGGAGGEGGTPKTTPTSNLTNYNGAGTSGSAGGVSTVIIDQIAMGPFAQMIPITYTCNPGQGGECVGPVTFDGVGMTVNSDTTGGTGGGGGYYNISGEYLTNESFSSSSPYQFYGIQNADGGNGSYTVTSITYNDTNVPLGCGLGNSYSDEFYYNNATPILPTSPTPANNNENGSNSIYLAFAIPMFLSSQSPNVSTINVSGGGGGASGIGGWNTYANFTNPGLNSNPSAPNVQGGGGGGGIGGSIPICKMNTTDTNNIAILNMFLTVLSLIANFDTDDVITLENCGTGASALLNLGL